MQENPDPERVIANRRDFRYHDANTGNANHRARNRWHHGQQIRPRNTTTQNLIFRNEHLSAWSRPGAGTAPPAYLRWTEAEQRARTQLSDPTFTLTYPQDISKYPVFTGVKRYGIDRDADEFACKGRNCADRRPGAGGMCNPRCTTAQWSTVLSEKWFKANVQLRLVSDVMGVGAYARRRLGVGQVVGEYLGEVQPCDRHYADDGMRAYILDVDRFGSGRLAWVDALRVGSWVRFMNHSCEANTQFAYRRIGDTMRNTVEVLRAIEVGEQITVDYGDNYWRLGGRVCGCGAGRCRFRGAGNAGNGGKGGNRVGKGGAVSERAKRLESRNRRKDEVGNRAKKSRKK